MFLKEFLWEAHLHHFHLKINLTLEKCPLFIFSINSCFPKPEFILKSCYSLTLGHTIQGLPPKTCVFIFSKNILGTFYFMVEKVSRFRTLSIYKRKNQNMFKFDNSFKYFATGNPFYLI